MSSWGRLLLEMIGVVFIGVALWIVLLPSPAEWANARGHRRVCDCTLAEGPSPTIDPNAWMDVHPDCTPEYDREGRIVAIYCAPPEEVTP